MTQTTDPRPDHWRAPWATPAGDGAAAAADAPTTPQPSAPATQPLPGAWPAPSSPVFGQDAVTQAPTQPHPAYQPGQPGQPGGWGGGLPPVPPPGAGRRDRRPGWGGGVAMGAGAAVLSSLLTAGIVSATSDDPVAASSTSASTGGSAAPAPVAADNVTSPDWGKVAAAVEPSVVSVKVQAGQSGGEGSGIVLDTSGHVLTNNHVVADAADGGQIQVVLSDGRTYSAAIVGRDPSTDLAVIKISGPPSDLRPAVLGDSSSVKVGDSVMALGNPLGLSDTVTTGIVSAVDRPVTTSASQSQQQLGGSGEQVVTNAIQTDAAVNPGNSGGALVDSRGRVVGITSSIASLSSSSFGGGQAGSIGLGFAIPVNVAKDISAQLIKSGTAQHAYMGVSLGDGTATSDGATRQAATIQQVSSGGPSDKAGLRDGDAVVAIDGEAVSGADSLVAQIRERRPGATVELTVVRGGQTQKVTLTLGTRPTSSQ